jgi:hypothetical protein
MSMIKDQGTLLEMWYLRSQDYGSQNGVAWLSLRVT